jgi:CRP/FNR family cyclic AMP-dependent transcriptional regulator
MSRTCPGSSLVPRLKVTRQGYGIALPEGEGYHGAMPEAAADLLSSLTLFADLGGPQLEGISHLFEEATFGPGQRILRQGISGSNFYVVVEGEAAVRIDGEERASIGRGDFFGEMSLLLGVPPTADVVARTPLRCLVLSGPELRGFLDKHPTVMYRMLVTMARRLRGANQQQA